MGWDSTGPASSREAMSLVPWGRCSSQDIWKTMATRPRLPAPKGTVTRMPGCREGASSWGTP